MLALGMISILVLAILGLAAYVVWRSEPRRFRLAAKLPFISINIEIDGQDERDKFPSGEDEPVNLPPAPGAADLPPSEVGP